MKRVTLKDVAQEAGLHVTSVSMAMRNHPRISSATRERVQAIAKRMGYRPDPVLSALNAYRHSKQRPAYQATLAWINDGPHRPENEVPWWYSDYFVSAQERAQELGYKLEEYCIPDLKMDGVGISRMLSSRNIPGIIIAPLPLGRTHIIDLKWDRFSALAIGYSLIRPRLHVVTNHHYLTMQEVITKLRSLGYERVSLVCCHDNDRRVNYAYTAMHWVDYYQQPTSRRVPPLMFKEALPTQEKLLRWYERYKPTAVICNDQKITQMFVDLGIMPGRDIAVASARASNPPGEPVHAGMDQNGHSIGSLSVDILVGMMQRNERGIPAVPNVTMVNSQWVSGWTVKED
ncbi:MAG: LacI family DNA-binding transcriptional regulator [Puniceicoccales bacterium]